MIDIALLTHTQRRAIVKHHRNLLSSCDREIGCSSGMSCRVFHGKATSHRAKAIIEKRIEELYREGKLKVKIRVPVQADSLRTQTLA